MTRRSEDLRIYTHALGAALPLWHDNHLNEEIDAVLKLPNGQWAGFEFKGGEA